MPLRRRLLRKLPMTNKASVSKRVTRRKTRKKKIRLSQRASQSPIPRLRMMIRKKRRRRVRRVKKERRERRGESQRKRSQSLYHR